VLTTVKSNGDLRPYKLLGGGRFDYNDLLGCEFLLPPGLIRIRATKNGVDLFMSLGEVTHGILLRISFAKHWSGSQSLVLCFPWVKNANVIQEAF
jgi:hypothetical protein